MARLNSKVVNWKPSKGKTKGIMSTYDAIEGNKDTLFHIHLANKSWGNEWYALVSSRHYENAKMVLAVRGKGNSLPIALNCLDDLIYLESEMREMEGVKKC